MIKNYQKLRDFEDRLIASTPVNVKDNFRIANELFEHAKAMGILPLKDPLEGLDEKIQVIKILNAFRRTP